MTYKEKVIEEFGEKYFMTEKGFIRNKTCVIDGEQYYRNSTTEEILDFISQALDNQMKLVMECLPERHTESLYLTEHRVANSVIEEIENNLKQKGLIK